MKESCCGGVIALIFLGVALLSIAKAQADEPQVGLIVKNNRPIPVFTADGMQCWGGTPAKLELEVKGTGPNRIIVGNRFKCRLRGVKP